MLRMVCSPGQRRPGARSQPCSVPWGQSQPGAPPPTCLTQLATAPPSAGLTGNPRGQNTGQGAFGTRKRALTACTWGHGARGAPEVTAAVERGRTSGRPEPWKDLAGGETESLEAEMTACLGAIRGLGRRCSLTAVSLRVCVVRPRGTVALEDYVVAPLGGLRRTRGGRPSGPRQGRDRVKP